MKRNLIVAIASCLTLALCAGADPNSGPLPAPEHPQFNTFSVVAFDPATGDLGIAVASRGLGVGSVVPWAKASVGAIATQSAANTSYGPRGLELLEKGAGAEEVLKKLIESDDGRDHRQVGIVDRNGKAAAFTGAKCLDWAGQHVGDHFTVQGNILPGEEVIKAMTEAYEKARRTEGTELADWLVAALKAGETAGGDKRGKQSAALMVAREKGGFGGNDRYIDLRVEDHAEPVTELKRLLELHKQVFADAHRNRPRREVKEEKR
ncbi:MAG TPA: DUF1028 domain-containing protein [Verrucomicrobia bacterium]|nr:DUF1028 domain-containing protein [Verrucomicrobiota bacterium]HOB32324.1 DUF1028 domain-containing protein [Verrucomicrobiota bacterium]HOP98110.1 DUF1028 domain-containing protein [Verrucomicrobiota bacterium]HPU55574.1 DUF1028 domain-containing protein [Verrucomicrobiota bacterium]